MSESSWALVAEQACAYTLYLFMPLYKLWRVEQRHRERRLCRGDHWKNENPEARPSDRGRLIADADHSAVKMAVVQPLERV